MKAKIEFQIITKINLYGWVISKEQDSPYPDLIRLTSPEGDTVVLVKDQPEQELLYRYFAGMLHRHSNPELIG